MLAAALGATLYSPATRPRLADDVVKQAARGVVSMVLCLEDSIDDADVDGRRGEPRPPVRRPRRTARRGELPLLFIRVRTPEQIPDLVRRLGPAVRLLSGFVLPKFTEERGHALPGGARPPPRPRAADRLFAMPVLESPELLYRESRVETLEGISRAVDKYRDRVLALRLGVTDFCSSYGLRRAPDMTAYDVQIVASVIADVVNMLGRADGTGFTVTGPVWEYFRVQERMFKPQLRRSPFLEGQAEELRADAASSTPWTGCCARSPSTGPTACWARPASTPRTCCPCTRCPWSATRSSATPRTSCGRSAAAGVYCRSAYTNKMNEVKPHRAWAERTLLRAEVFGVANEDIGFVELLAAGLSGGLDRRPSRL